MFYCTCPAISQEARDELIAAFIKIVPSANLYFFYTHKTPGTFTEPFLLEHSIFPLYQQVHSVEDPVFRSVARSSIPHLVCPSVRPSVADSFSLISHILLRGWANSRKFVATQKIMYGHLIWGGGAPLLSPGLWALWCPSESGSRRPKNSGSAPLQ